MVECKLPVRIDRDFQKLGELNQDSAEALFMVYDNYARANPECADPSRYVSLATVLQKGKSHSLTDLALRRALISSTKLWVPYFQMAMLYDEMGHADVGDYLRSIDANVRGTGLHLRKAGEYWQDVECKVDISECPGELEQVKERMEQHVRRYLLQFLFSKFYNINSVGSQYLNDFLASPELHVIWKNNPQEVVKIIEHFLGPLESMRGRDYERLNTLLVLRDLLKLLAQSIDAQSTKIHLDDPASLLQKYMRDNGKPMSGIGEGVAIFFNFLLKFSGMPLPDTPLQVFLRQYSDSKILADRVALLSSTINKTTGAKRGRK